MFTQIQRNDVKSGYPLVGHSSKCLLKIRIKHRDKSVQR